MIVELPDTPTSAKAIDADIVIRLGPEWNGFNQAGLQELFGTRLDHGFSHDRARATERCRLRDVDPGDGILNLYACSPEEA